MSDLSRRLGIQNVAQWSDVELRDRPVELEQNSLSGIAQGFEGQQTDVLHGFGVIRDIDTPVLPKPSPMEIMGASMFGMARDLYSAYEEDQQGFDRDPKFDSISYTSKLLEQLGDLSEDENRMLVQAKSQTQADWRVGRILDQRMRHQTQAQGLGYSVVGSLVDADLLVGLGAAKAASALPKVYQVTKLRTAASIAAGTTVLTYGTTSHWDADTRSESQKLVDAAVMGLSFGLGVKTAKSLKTGATAKVGVESLQETSQKAARNAQDAFSGSQVGYPTREGFDAILSDSGRFKRESKLFAENLGKVWKPQDLRELQASADRAASAYSKAQAKAKQGKAVNLSELKAEAARTALMYSQAQHADKTLRVAREAGVDAESLIKQINPEDTREYRIVDSIAIQDDLGEVHMPIREYKPVKDNEDAVRRAAQGRTQAGSTRLKRHLSTVDKLAYFANTADTKDWELVKSLYPDAAFSNYDTAINRAILIQRKGHVALNKVDEAIGNAAKEFYGGTGRFGSLSPLDMQNSLRIEKEVQREASNVLRKLYAVERRARHMDEVFDAERINAELARLSPNQGITDVVKAYIDSGFAKLHLDAMRRSGVKGADEVAESSVYTPLRWDYGKMLRAMQQGLPREQLAKMFGTDLVERFPELLTHGRNTQNIGEEFLRTQELAAQGLYQQPMAATRDTVRAMLTNFGVAPPETDDIIERMFKQVDEAGKPKNLRRRNDWDFERKYVVDGHMYSLGDFADDNLMQNLRTYNSTSAHRAGLAHYGIQGESDLNALWQRLMKNPKEGISRSEYKAFFEELNNQLLGRPVGAELPEIMRTAEAVAYAVNMSNSGIYNLMDGTAIALQVGIARTVKHTVKTMPDVFKSIQNLAPREAQRLKDVLTGDVLSEGRLNKVVSHFEDMHSMEFGAGHTWVHRAAQSVKFLNASEFIRRWQVNTIASAYEEVLEKGVRNPVGREADILRGVGMTDADITAIRGQIDKHGMYINKWAVGVSERAQQLIQGSMDDTAMFVRKGEAPAFLEHTSVGKVMFPYMRYAMAGNQKILRRVYNSGGSSAVAQLMFMQATLAPVLAATINITNGRPWDKDLEVGAVRASTSLGYFSIAADAFMAGGMKGSAAAFSPLNSTYQLGRNLVDDESTVYDVTNAVPWLGISVLNMGLGVVKSMQADDNQSKREINSKAPKRDY